MAIAFRGSATGTVINGGVLSVSLTGIAGLAQNDVVVVFALSTAGTAANPSGWNSLQVFNDAGGAHVSTAWKRMGASPDTSITYWDTGGTGDGGCAVALAFSGVDQTTAIDVTTTVLNDTSGSTAAPNPPSITPTSADCAIVIFGGETNLFGGVDASRGTVASYSTPVDATATDSASAGVSGAYRILTGGAGAAQNPAAWSTWVTAAFSLSATIALRPTTAITETVTVTQATVTLTGKTVTVLNTEKVTVTQATVTLTGKTVTVRETELVAVAKANVVLAGQAVTPTDFFVERITVDAAAVLFTGRTVDLVEIVGGALDLDFINDASIASKVTCVRAGTANMDNYAGNWSAVAANALRLSDKGLLVESARTNSLPNNSMQGAVVGVIGSGGVAPTSWAINTSGCVRQIVGVGTENGIDYIDIRISGASGTTGQLSIATPSTAIGSSAGTTWTVSAWMKLVAGSLTTGLSPSGMVLRVSGELAGTVLNTGLVDATWKRIINSRTLSGTTAAWVLRFSTVDTVTPIDFTLRIGWPQLENGVVPSSPIRTTTVAVTRAADVVTVNSPPAINAVAGGLFAEYVVPYDAFVSSTFYMIQVDDGTTNNRLVLLEQTAADQNTCFVTSGGVSQVISLGHGNVYPYGTVTRSAMRYAANDVAFSNDGLGPVFDTTVTLPVGMNRFGIGSNGTGSVNTFAYIRHLKYFDDPPTDAELVEMTTAPVETVGVDHGFLELTGQPVTPTNSLPVTNATVAFAGKTVTVRDTSTTAVVAGAITITGKTVTIRDATVVAVGHGLLALTGKPITIVSAMPVTRATVMFAGKTITIVNSTFQDIPKYIIRGRGSRHDIKGRGSRVFLVTR